MEQRGFWLVCKLDIEKAYDHVNWKFVLSIIEKMSFGHRWRQWIHYYISTVRLSILFNGTSTIYFFQSSRGLRQSGPLFPYLLVLIMGAFSCHIAKVEQGGFKRCFKVEDGEQERINISHLLFAYNTLSLCKDDVDEFQYRRWIVVCFELVLSLKINLQRSEMLWVDRLASLFRCKVRGLPTSHLGLPLGVFHNSCAVWDWVKEGIRKRLASCEKRYLFKGGQGKEDPIEPPNVLHVPFFCSQKSRY